MSYPLSSLRLMYIDTFLKSQIGINLVIIVLSFCVNGDGRDLGPNYSMTCVTLTFSMSANSICMSQGDQGDESTTDKFVIRCTGSLLLVYGKWPRMKGVQKEGVEQCWGLLQGLHLVSAVQFLVCFLQVLVQFRTIVVVVIFC